MLTLGATIARLLASCTGFAPRTFAARVGAGRSGLEVGGLLGRSAERSRDVRRRDGFFVVHCLGIRAVVTQDSHGSFVLVFCGDHLRCTAIMCSEVEACAELLREA
jgi:hypothetical protein